jgi:hypothetical protein
MRFQPPNPLAVNVSLANWIRGAVSAERFASFYIRVAEIVLVEPVGDRHARIMVRGGELA